MRYLVKLDTGASIRIDAPTLERAAELVVDIVPGLKTRTIEIAGIEACGTLTVEDGWCAA